MPNEQVYVCLMFKQTLVRFMYVLHTHNEYALGTLHAHIFGGHSLRKC